MAAAEPFCTTQKTAEPDGGYINLLLYDGTLQGVVCIKDPSWNRGEMYLAPREALEELLARGACSKLCIYLLLCGDKPGLVNLRILEGTLRDIVSGTDFSRFVVARVPY